MNGLKITVSGSYKTANGDIVDFEDVTGVIPNVEEEYAKMHVRSRYASEWVRGALDKAGEKLYKQRIDMMTQVFIDDIEPVNHNFSYVGKDIKKMSDEELQDLATAKDLRKIPLPKKVSGVDLREARTQAYVAYSEKVLGQVIDVNNPVPEYASKAGDRLVFDFAKLPALKADGDARVDVAQKMTNEEIIEQEQKPMMNNETPKSTLTHDELKEIAKTKNIPNYWVMSEETLYNTLFGNQAA